ncbi:hypothetical protein ACFFQW_11330 [Umezawaea endophytica]|uniref:Uncharacterized protein n=1 Tax=Umezawaea endophytica TaxID=1654476 RepID=A0A9X2VJZ0_9PSEU|nr:hypothetical protein [Umezawaea endophytica]MCS7478011.1 hypothetical protein [Umezawaea endophytica]
MPLTRISSPNTPPVLRNGAEPSNWLSPSKARSCTISGMSSTP